MQINDLHELSRYEKDDSLTLLSLSCIYDISIKQLQKSAKQLQQNPPNQSEFWTDGAYLNHGENSKPSEK